MIHKKTFLGSYFSTKQRNSEFLKKKEWFKTMETKR
jgi:hypothetical protein